MRKFIWLTILVLFFSSCQNQEKKALEIAFSQAGSNKNELKKVLDHYSEPKDSLKKQAAIFLIKNMPAHYFLESKEFDRYNRIFDILETQLVKHTDYESFNLLTSIMDSIEKIDGRLSMQNLNQQNDTRRVSANFIIQNIDYAFRAWKKNPWSKNIDFNCFCDYILPYRLYLEPIENWRPPFYDIVTEMGNQSPNPKDIKETYLYLHKILTKSYAHVDTKFEPRYPFPMSFSNVQKAGIGSCFQTGIFQTMALRSAGLPVTIDYTPYWGGYKGSHSRLKLISGEKYKKLLTNENLQEDVSSIFKSSNFFNKKMPRFAPGDFPENVTVTFNKLIPKVYRYTWSIQPERLQIMNKAKNGEIAPGFRLYEKDVTNEYLVCGNTTIYMDCNFSRHKIAYLTVFNNGSWVPVASSVINQEGYASFKNMGKKIIYLPAVYEENRMVPTGKPFYFNDRGNVVTISASKQHVQDIKIISKYPFFAIIAYHAFEVKGGKFEGANKSDFSDADSLLGINYLPYYYQEVNVKNSKAFRYLRFVAPKNQKCSLAELKFYGVEDGDTMQIQGTFFDIKGSDTPILQKVADNNLETFYESDSEKLNWIGFDLGETIKRRIVKIDFCPRNDANCIIPEKEYELFFWNKDWVSLGKQKASKRYLIYKNIPTGALLLLKCHSGGKEERIFLYEKDKQVWF